MPYSAQHFAPTLLHGLRLLAVVLLCSLHLGCARTNDQPLLVDERVELSWNTIFNQPTGVSSAVVAPTGDLLAVVIGDKIKVLGVESSTVLNSATDSTRQAAGVVGRSPAWSADGRRLAWISNQQLWIGDLHQDGTISSSSAVSTNLPGIRNPSWSPAGDRIAVYAAKNGTDDHQDIYLIDANSGANEPATVQLTFSAADRDDVRFTPQWSPDGHWIAMISNQGDWWHDDVWIVNTANSESYQVSTTFMASSSPVWSPTSSAASATLVAMGTPKAGYWYQDLADLIRIDLDLSQPKPLVRKEAVIPMQVHATDFIMRFDPYLSGDGATVFFPFHERGAFDLWAVSVDGGVATRVTNVGGAWSSLSSTANGDSAVFIRDAPVEGREAWMVVAEGGPARPLTRATPRFADIQIPQEISFRSFDGLYIQGFLYLPPQLRGSQLKPPDPAATLMQCPALVQVHGGGTNSYYQGTNLTEQVLASHGFPVLAINYRGGSGFGREFQDLNIEDWLNDQSKDPGAAADWIRAQPWSNGNVGIYGGSYGGMQSMSAITRTPTKFDAAVPMRGIYSEELTLPFADRLGKIFTITGHGGTPEERPDTYAKSETLDRFDRITAPVLIMHGERDVRAPFRNFELAVERLEALGKQFESRTYPEGHAFRDPKNLIDMYSRLENFFRRHLGTCSPGNDLPG